MKNLRSNVLRLLAVTLALSSAPTIAQTSSAIDKSAGLNTPEIKVVGKGLKRKNLFGKIIDTPFVLRSSPVESEAEVYLFRDNYNYDILTCKTPCLFQIPIMSTFRFNVKTPPGFIQISKVAPIQWGRKDLVIDVIKPDDITFYFVPQ
jgi:hypothetical protein